MVEVLDVAGQPWSARVAVSGVVCVLQGGMVCTVGPGRLGSLEGELMQERTGYEEYGGSNGFPKPEKSPRTVGDIAVAVVPLTVSLKAERRSQGCRTVAHLGVLELHRIPPLLENMAVGTHCPLPT
jgi:hypothetical protein